VEKKDSVVNGIEDVLEVNAQIQKKDANLLD